MSNFYPHQQEEIREIAREAAEDALGEIHVAIGEPAELHSGPTFIEQVAEFLQSLPSGMVITIRQGE